MSRCVLLVEDDAEMRRNLAFLIEKRGFHVTTARNGKDALAKLEDKGSPCLIILDLMMPVMDGWEFRSRMLAMAELASVPVVLLSGVADIQREVRALKAIDYLVKPIELKRLYKIIDDHCGDHAEPGEPAPRSSPDGGTTRS